MFPYAYALLSRTIGGIACYIHTNLYAHESIGQLDCSWPRWSIMVKNSVKSVGARMQPFFMPFVILKGRETMLLCLTWPSCSLCSWMTMTRNFGGQPSFSRIVQSTFLPTLSNTFSKFIKVMNKSLVLLTALLLNHGSGSPIGPKTTLALWKMFICNSRYKSVWQYSCSNFAGDGENGYPTIVTMSLKPSIVLCLINISWTPLKLF